MKTGLDILYEDPHMLALAIQLQAVVDHPATVKADKDEGEQLLKEMYEYCETKAAQHNTPSPPKYKFVRGAKVRI